jgi:hypothetical protein
MHGTTKVLRGIPIKPLPTTYLLAAHKAAPRLIILAFNYPRVIIVLSARPPQLAAFVTLSDGKITGGDSFFGKHPPKAADPLCLFDRNGALGGAPAR